MNNSLKLPNLLIQIPTVVFMVAIFATSLRAAPLTESDVISLLKATVPAVEVAEAIAKNGYKGLKTPEELARIRAAGGDVSLLLSIRNSKSTESLEKEDTVEKIRSPKDRQNTIKMIRALVESLEKRGENSIRFNFVDDPVDLNILSLMDVNRSIEYAASEAKDQFLSEKKATQSKLNWYYIAPNTQGVLLSEAYSEATKSYGYVGVDKSILIPFQFLETQPFDWRSLAIVKSKEGLYGIINSKGVYLWKPTSDSIIRAESGTSNPDYVAFRVVNKKNKNESGVVTIYVSGEPDTLFGKKYGDYTFEKDTEKPTESPNVKTGGLDTKITDIEGDFIRRSSYESRLTKSGKMEPFPAFDLACKQFVENQKNPATRILDAIDRDLFILQKFSEIVLFENES